MLCLVCFDISDNKVRTRVGKYLGGFGSRVQKSVFEVEVDDHKALLYLQKRLGEWLEENDDLRFYPLCKSCCQGAKSADNKRIAKLPSLVLV